DIQPSNYDHDQQMKKVMNNFNRQISQRFEEYEERMQEKRQKRKEQRDKNIQKIIEKDKMEKSLAEKIEIGCLRCGCGLGGVAASVGLFGGLGTYGWKSAAIAAAKELGTAAMADATAKGAAAGKEFVIVGLKKLYVLTLDGKELGTYITATNYHNASFISSAIIKEYQPSQCAFTLSGTRQAFCNWVNEKAAAATNVQRMTGVGVVSYNDLIQTTVENIVSDAEPVATAAAQQATKDAIKSSTLLVEAKYATCQTAIIASVVALLIIVLVMIIIYLVLRYRRKKKMNKKKSINIWFHDIKFNIMFCEF
ncbi:rifin, partial [Plasmodium reichenowi]